MKTGQNGFPLTIRGNDRFFAALALATFTLLFMTTPAFTQEQLAYKFTAGRPVNYALNLDGTVTYGYQGVKPETVKAQIQSVLTIMPDNVSAESAVLTVTPRKTIVKLNGMVMEDTTGSETAVSTILPVSRIALSPQGTVISVEDITDGMVSISQMLKILPTFPADKIFPGMRWTQTMPSLRFPGIPLCDLKFNYLYEGIKDGTAVITIQSNQTIKEKKRDKDVTVTINGKNTSAGKFLFAPAAGEMASFTGDFDITIYIIFSMPAGPELKGKQPETIPLNAVIKLKLSLSRLSPIAAL